MISIEALKEFKDIWKQEYGEDIPDNFALENAIALLTLTNMTYRPIKQEWLDEIESDKQKNKINNQQ